MDIPAYRPKAENRGGCLNDFLAGLTRWLIRAVVVVAGLVIFLSLLAAVLVLALSGNWLFVP